MSYRGNPYCGGQGVYLYYLTKALSGLGHKLVVLVGPPYPEEMPWAEVYEIPNENFINRSSKDFLPEDFCKIFEPMNLFEFGLSRVGANPEMLAFSLRCFFLIRKLIKKQRFDLVHDNQSLGYGLLLIKNLGIPVVSTIHHPLQVDRKEDLAQMHGFGMRVRRALYYPLLMQKVVARRLDGLLTVSEQSERLIKKWYNVPDEKIRKIYNGVDLEMFKPMPWIKKIPSRVLFVGSTEDRKKGILYLLRAIKMLAGANPGIHLVIADGRLNPKRVYAKNLVKRMGLEKRVFFLEKIPHKSLVEEYNRAGVVVVPSLFEGFGLPALEAMACGCAIVASRAGALPEVVGEDGECAILVPPKDERAIALAIGRIVDRAELCSELGRRARKRAELFFSWEKCAKEVAEFYEELLLKSSKVRI